MALKWIGACARSALMGTAAAAWLAGCGGSAAPAPVDDSPAPTQLDAGYAVAVPLGYGDARIAVLAPGQASVGAGTARWPSAFSATLTQDLSTVDAATGSTTWQSHARLLYQPSSASLTVQALQSPPPAGSHVWSDIDLAGSADFTPCRVERLFPLGTAGTDAWIEVHGYAPADAVVGEQRCTYMAPDTRSALQTRMIRLDGSVASAADLPRVAMGEGMAIVTALNDVAGVTIGFAVMEPQPAVAGHFRLMRYDTQLRPLGVVDGGEDFVPAASTCMLQAQFCPPPGVLAAALRAADTAHSQAAYLNINGALRRLSWTGTATHLSPVLLDQAPGLVAGDRTATYASVGTSVYRLEGDGTPTLLATLGDRYSSMALVAGGLTLFDSSNAGWVGMAYVPVDGGAASIPVSKASNNLSMWSVGVSPRGIVASVDGRSDAQGVFQARRRLSIIDPVTAHETEIAGEHQVLGVLRPRLRAGTGVDVDAVLYCVPYCVGGTTLMQYDVLSGATTALGTFTTAAQAGDQWSPWLVEGWSDRTVVVRAHLSSNTRNLDQDEVYLARPGVAGSLRRLP